MVSESAPRGMTWKVWAEIAEFSETVDFGCGFDCNGKCTSIRMGPSNWTNREESACCSDCANSSGYLQDIPIEAVATVKAIFDENTGFWAPGGCRLPRKWRSYACLTYRCYRAGMDGESKDYKQLCEYFHKCKSPIVLIS